MNEYKNQEAKNNKPNESGCYLKSNGTLYIHRHINMITSNDLPYIRNKNDEEKLLNYPKLKNQSNQYCSELMKRDNKLRTSQVFQNRNMIWLITNYLNPIITINRKGRRV